MELRKIGFGVRCENMFDMKEIESHLKLLIDLHEENFNLANDCHEIYTKVSCL